MVHAAIIAAVHDGCRRADDAFYFAGVVGVGDAHRDAFATVLRRNRIACASCAGDFFSCDHPLVADIALHTVAIVDGCLQDCTRRRCAADGGNAAVIGRAADIGGRGQVDVIGDDTGIFGIEADAAAGVGSFVIGKGGDDFAVDTDFYGIAVFADDKILGLR